MRKDALKQDDDTWSMLGLAALRVLSKIEQVKDFEACEQQQTDRSAEADHDEAHRAERADVIGNKKRSA
ncbi:MAG TPA: hypothetical protein VF447_14850 [Terriglobales bacterium]